MQPWKRKVKIPARVGVGLTITLGLLAGLGTVPALAPACTAATLAITTAVGYWVSE